MKEDEGRELEGNSCFFFLITTRETNVRPVGPFTAARRKIYVLLYRYTIMMGVWRFVRVFHSSSLKIVKPTPSDLDIAHGIQVMI